MDFLREQDDFTYHVYDEDVPMAKLVELCRTEEVSIRDIFISDVVEKYIAYVRDLEEKNYENISDFLVLASTLLEIKSKTLLPRPEVVDEIETEEVGDEELFFRRMELYKRLSDVSVKMGELEQLNRFYRDPDFDERDYNLVIKNFSLDKMIGAFKQLLERVEYAEEESEPKTIVKERFTVADRVLALIEEIQAYKVVKFYSLFQPDYSRLEIINTFLALLEVLKQQIATAEQDEPFGDIYLRCSEMAEEQVLELQEKLLNDAEEYN